MCVHTYLQLQPHVRSAYTVSRLAAVAWRVGRPHPPPRGRAIKIKMNSNDPRVLIQTMDAKVYKGYTVHAHNARQCTVYSYQPLQACASLSRSTSPSVFARLNSPPQVKSCE